MDLVSALLIIIVTCSGYWTLWIAAISESIERRIIYLFRSIVALLVASLYLMEAVFRLPLLGYIGFAIWVLVLFSYWIIEGTSLEASLFSAMRRFRQSLREYILEHL